MEKEVILAPDVNIFFKELAYLLFTKEYFGFLEDAQAYTDKVYDYMMHYIGIISGKPAPAYFARYGNNLEYIVYRANRSTSWYIFYQQQENRFLIRHITNNHVAGQYILA